MLEGKHVIIIIVQKRFLEFSQNFKEEVQNSNGDGIHKPLENPM